ncbi:MAG: glycosyltransferase [Candidatus Lokiarchaeota archaeon]|nr:glycosyltransferase [Candidatus Lokiarchaeota archaeon]
MKKKVLLFVPSLRRGGGAEKVASKLSFYLSENYEVFILTLFDFKKKNDHAGKYHSLKMKYFIIEFIPDIIRIKAIISLLNPDLIITFMNKTSFIIIPMKYIFNIKIPLVVCMNSNPNLQYQKRVYGKIFLKLFYNLNRLQVIIPVSKDLKKILIEKYGINSNKIITIYNGLNISEIREKAKKPIEQYKELFESNNYYRFISMGRLSPEKGFHVLIEGFKRTLKKIPNGILLIIGDGPQKESLKKLIYKNDLDKKVFLLGFKENPYKYMKRADTFILSSFNEVLPYSLIEALVCRLPVISTDCQTGPREILEDGKYGLLVEVGNGMELSEKMILLATNKKLREHFIGKAQEKIFDFKDDISKKKWNLLASYLLGTD